MKQFLVRVAKKGLVSFFVMNRFILIRKSACTTLSSTLSLELLSLFLNKESQFDDCPVFHDLVIFYLGSASFDVDALDVLDGFGCFFESIFCCFFPAIR